MVGEKVTVEGLQANNRRLGRFDGDECTRHAYKQHAVKFRLYPIASHTGVCANGPYERALGVFVYDHIKRYYGRSNYRVGHLREQYGICPEGYSCKYFELPVYVKTTEATDDKVVWIENEFSY